MGNIRLPLIGRYGVAASVAAAITFVLLLVDSSLESANIALFYLLGVLLVAMIAGLGPGILASLLNFLAFNFFFVPPLYTFHVEDPQNVLRLISYLIVAVLTSGLAARARTESNTAERRAEEMTALYSLSQAISAQVDLDQILPTIAQTTCRLLNTSMCVILLYDEQGHPYEHTVVGELDPRLHLVSTFMRDGAAVLGALRVAEHTPSGGLNQHERWLLDALAAQAQLAIERARLVKQLAHIQALAESDQLKSALISSVSHDLRTPLAVIKGAVSTLLADDVSWDQPTQRALGQTIDVEADRLVGNLLSMSRIESGALQITRDWEDLAEVIGSVLQRMAPQLDGHPVAVELAPDLPLVSINATLIDQVFTNLLENSVRYTPPGTPITISARREQGEGEPHILVTIRDRGPGIPLGQITRIFDKFYRGPSLTSADGGAGLGLAICKGIIEAHHGCIWATNDPEGGAMFLFTLPLTTDHRPPTTVPQERGRWGERERGRI
jgi:two-component system sensor histidine kinase KdpD